MTSFGKQKTLQEEGNATLKPTSHLSIAIVATAGIGTYQENGD